MSYIVTHRPGFGTTVKPNVNPQYTMSFWASINFDLKPRVSEKPISRIYADQYMMCLNDLVNPRSSLPFRTVVDFECKSRILYSPIFCIDQSQAVNTDIG